ncbi:MAG: glycosyltransferase [Eubacteriales bacterium]
MDTKRLLYTASTTRHLKHFHQPYMAMLEEKGAVVDILANGSATDFPEHRFFNIPFYKKILSPKNIGIVLKIRKILKKNKYDVIVLNTALTAALVRLALPKRIKRSTRVVNISHGYFFGQNISPKKNKLYLSIERILAKKTDDIVVMNSEDLAYAKKFGLCSKNVFFVHGMGYDPKKYFGEVKSLNNAPTTDLVYVAEHSERKNHKELFSAMAKAVQQGANLTLTLAGDGKLLEENKRLAKSLGLAERINFLGYINNVIPVYSTCDYVVSTSKIEGLPFNLLEALACGIPCIVSDVKGNRDLIKNENNGYIYKPGDIDRLAQILAVLNKNTRTYMHMQAEAKKSVTPYAIEATKKEFAAIFDKVLIG